MTQLLVLRPEPDAGTTAAKARELGLEAIAVPLFEVEALDWTGPDPARFNGLLLTSANAIRCAGKQLERYRGLKVYAVGEATAAEAVKAGFELGATGKAGVERLLASIEPDLELLHLCGEHRRVPDGVRQTITPTAVYRSKETEHPALPDLSGSVALIHSPRAGQRFAQLVTRRNSISIAAISRAAAAGTGSGWRRVEVAGEPNNDALLALGARLCNNG